MMRWRYKVRGGHTHARVYCNGALCGTLIFRNDEFQNILGIVQNSGIALIEFEEEK